MRRSRHDDNEQKNRLRQLKKRLIGKSPGPGRVGAGKEAGRGGGTALSNPINNRHFFLPLMFKIEKSHTQREYFKGYGKYIPVTLMLALVLVALRRFYFPITS